MESNTQNLVHKVFDFPYLRVPLIFVQVIISFVSVMVYPIKVELRMRVATEKHVELFCNLPLEGMLIPLSYNIILSLGCAVFGR